MKRQLSDHLVNRGVVTEKEIQRCVLRAGMNERSVVEELTERLDLSEQNLAREMAEFWGFEYWGQPAFEVVQEHREVVSRSQAIRCGVLPVDTGSDAISLAVFDVDKARPVIEEVRRSTGHSPSVIIAPRSVVEREIARHYRDDSPAVGVVKRTRHNKRRQSRHEVLNKMPKRSHRGGDEETTVFDPLAELEQPSTVGAVKNDQQPTRQVDLGAIDNPFMDLVQQTATTSSESSLGDEATGPASYEGGSEAKEEEFDFFGDIGGDKQGAMAASDEEEPSALKHEEESDVEEGLGDFDSALEAFDAQLDGAESTSDPLLEDSHSVNWGDYEGDGGGDHFGPEGSQPIGLGASMTSRPTRRGSQSGASGLFPLRRGESGLIRIEHDQQLTLAELVERQGKMIERLQREVEYQKGILQNMAELLVEARVLSRAKLKERLKAFKEKQRESYKD